MKLPALQKRTLALIAVIAPLLALFIWVALRSGPLSPVAVTVAAVDSRAVTPALFGTGTAQARHVHKIGPTLAGRVKRLDVNVGDVVKAGQTLGEMDPVDLDERLRAQQSGIQAAEAALRQAEAKLNFARGEAQRYERLLAASATSAESTAIKRQELAVAEAAQAAARADVARLRAEGQALAAQRGNLRLVTPVAGLVATRAVDPGTTVVAGQSVVEVVDPGSLWIDTRFDQIGAEGLAPGLPAQIVLRSRRSQPLAGKVLRIEPLADAVTEETLAKVVFDALPTPLPPLGELAEVTVQLPALPAVPTVPNAAIRTEGSQRGVWKLDGSGAVFTPVTLGRADLDGRVQVREGLAAGDQVVVYSEKPLNARSRLHVVERIPGVKP